MKKAGFVVEVRLFGQTEWAVSPRLPQTFATAEEAAEEAEYEFPVCFYGLATRVVPAAASPAVKK